MKSSMKRLLRALGRRLKSLLRPLIRKVDGRFTGLVEATVRPLVVAELELRVRPALDATTEVVRENIDRTQDVVQFLRRSAQENTLLLDSLVRELVRVQMQLETLQDLVADQGPDPSSLDEHENDPAAPYAPTRMATSSERLMIG
jgi:hypothetical protein